MKALRIASMALAGWLLAACAGDPARDGGLYEDLGQRSGIQQIVDETLRNIADDARIVRLFADSDIGRLRTKLAEQLCMISGGPCRYTGDTMEQVHTGMNLDEADFNAFVENLFDAMDELNVPVAAQNRLVARLAPMRDRIIHR